MPRVICRCGEKIKLSAGSLEYVNCPRCSARIKLRSGPPMENAEVGDGFIRFLCPCGRRLKVPADDAPKAGRCPDCGRVVPVPTSTFDRQNLTSGKNDAETRTQDLDVSDLAELKKWSDRYRTDSGPSQRTSAQSSPLADHSGPDNGELAILSGTSPRASVVKFETGLRICPQCQKPLHLGSDICRDCGIVVPRQ
jgi:hypothetical protein